VIVINKRQTYRVVTFATSQFFVHFNFISLLLLAALLELRWH